jgi:uncharacterized protein (TIGR00251 family)
MKSLRIIFTLRTPSFSAVYDVGVRLCTDNHKPGPSYPRSTPGRSRKTYMPKKKAINDGQTEKPGKKDSFYFWEGDVLVLRILGTPGAKRDAIGKPKGDQLKVSVTESPERGKATDHMVHFLAKEFGVSPKDIEVVTGRFNVNKLLRIKTPGILPACIKSSLDRIK